jgi:GMP synthase (glutamine-hydrolysing)
MKEERSQDRRSTVLAVNAMREAGGQRNFARSITELVAAAGFSAEVVPVESLSDRPPRPDDYAAVILSGSEAGVTEPQSWEPGLRAITERTIGEGVPLLGICYGAQFIAKTLAGPDAVGTLATPEFGYVRLPLDAASATTEPLFSGIASPIGVEIHYDYIRRAPDGFRILIRNETCIQAMRHERAPIAAYQFHPEVGYDYGRKVFAKLAEEEPRFPEAFHEELQDPAELAQNARFVTNFLEVYAPGALSAGEAGAGGARFPRRPAKPPAGGAH